MSDSVGSRHIIINGLPNNVTPEKRAAFQRHCERKFSDLLGPNMLFNLTLVTDQETGLVMGAFMTLATESDAETALAKLNMFPLTRSDVLRTYRWSALKRAQEEPGEYVPPTLPDDDEENDDFTNPMTEDEQARPQYVIKGGNWHDCEWYWFDWDKNKPVLYRKPNARKEDAISKWSEMDRRNKTLRKGLVSSLIPAARPLPVWSTYGTMMISEHDTGLRVWGGRQMNLLFEIVEDVEAFMVSPGERFIVIKTANDLSVWNLRTARKIRALGNLDLHTDDLWPITRFSADDSLVAVCKTGYVPESGDDVGIGKLNIYVSERMRVVRGEDDTHATSHTFAIPGLYKADWNPAVGTQIAYVSCLGSTLGWKVVIANVLYNAEDNVASQEVLTQRNFLNAQRLDMLWHPAGTHLAVKVTLKKGNIEYCLFHIAPRSVAAIQLQVKPGHSAERFAWQPGGDYFAIILKKEAAVGASAVSQLAETSLLQIHSVKQNKPKQLFEAPTSTTNLLWAPKGTHIAAINFDKSLMHFLYINDSGVVIDRKKMSNISGTDAQWDPTGRFLATWVSTLRNTTMATQYRIFDYNGNELFRKEMKPFSHFAWRPLPPSLATDEEVKRVKESMKLLMDDYENANEQRAEVERARIKKEQQDLEEAYVRKMNDIARKAIAQRLRQKREELQQQSLWSRHWRVRMQALPDDERMIHEDVVEERITSRRQVNA